MWQPLWAPMTIASCGQSGKCQCVVPFWSRLAIARLAPRCSCHTGPCHGSESSVSMYNCQNGHNWQLPVWGQSGQNLLCRLYDFKLAVMSMRSCGHCTYVLVHLFFAQSNFNFVNEATFTFQPILQLDLIWPLTLTSSTREGSRVASMTQLWLKSIIAWGHFSLFSLSYNLTSYDLWPWPHQQERVPVLHLWPNFGWNPS